MSSKAALKAINDAIRQQKFDDAVEKSNDFLNREPKNYQCQIFLAFALDKQGKLDESEKVYQKATQLRPQDPQAWQGLVKLFEKQGTKKLTEYQQVVISLAQIFKDADDLYKAQDVSDKFVDYVRVNGDKLQYADALWTQLPESPLYSILEGRLPDASKVYESIAHILEDCEKKRINTLIGERRTRIGAKLSEVTLEVKREVYAQSRLEHVYRQLINWTRDDEVRRAYEERLLQYCYDRLLAAAPGPAKDDERKKVHGLANDMVVIKHPYRLAWDIAVDWEDSKELEDMNVETLRRYCEFFPETDLYKVITSFLSSSLSPFAKEEQGAQKQKEVSEETDDSEDDDDGGVPTSIVPLTDDDRLLMITEGVLSTSSMLAYRLGCRYFLHIGDYETTVEYSRKALANLELERAKSGMTLNNTEDAYSICLGTGLVYHQSPRHHQEAKHLFEGVLEHDPASTPAFIGVGLIFEEEEEYDSAIDFLSRALKRDGTNLRVKSEAAWVKALKGDYATARGELEECIKLLQKPKESNRELLADCQYRLGYCVWNLDTSRQARKQRKGDCAYAYWLSALTNNTAHAPTYTSLGVFYQDYAKDTKRARRCFQKALELSPSEVVAAERLARSFADDGDWDRVELVAQRVVNSGKVKPPPGSKRKGISWPFAALGVAELNKQEFHKSIVSFQAALRISPNDYHCWVGLGESYYSSGRYIAATKAIIKAQELEDDTVADMKDDTWFTKYMLANVKRELGEHDEAIDLYRAVMETHANEEGAVIALMQTSVDSAMAGIEKGLFGKSVQLATEVITFASEAQDRTLQTFNFWKTLGDACSVFSAIQSRVTEFPPVHILDMLERARSSGDYPPEAQELMFKVDKVTLESVISTDAPADETETEKSLRSCLHASILCHKQAIHVSSSDLHGQAVSYYNLGWAEHRAHACLSPDARTKPSGYSKAAIRSFKRAIELEAGNSEFWNALGVVTSEVNPAVAQHAFVRSLHLNERSPVAWTNLGVLALLSGDLKVANEVFTRAQSTDPDYTHAWVSQGFIALLHGDAKEARGLFTHAMEISESSSVSTRNHYSSSTFDHILTLPSGANITSLVQPLFALNQVQSLRPDDLAAGHLAALFGERTRETGKSVEALEKISAVIEAEYERTESSSSLANFTLAKTDLARAYLAAGENDKAVECGEMALSLSSDEAESGLDVEQCKKARLSGNLTVGLAKYFLGQFGEAVKCFEAALEEADNNPDAVCLLAQVRWAQGSEEARDEARASLFDVIEKQPDHVRSVLLLGVIALLDKDEDSLEAVTEELQGIRANGKVTALEQSHISDVLRAIAILGEGKTEQDVLAQVQNDAMMHPHLPHGWSALAEATGSSYAAQMALKVATRGIPPRGELEAADLARAHAGTGVVADAQRAAFLAPWEVRGWDALEAATNGIIVKTKQ